VLTSGVSRHTAKRQEPQCALAELLAADTTTLDETAGRLAAERTHYRIGRLGSRGDVRLCT
jgi:hypothetical protein